MNGRMFFEAIVGEGLGFSQSSYTQVGSLCPAVSMTQTGLRMFYNATNGNMVVLNHPVIVDEVSGLLEIGFVYNSLPEDPRNVWRTRIKKFNSLPQGNLRPGSIVLTEEDGHETAYLYNDVTQQYHADEYADGRPYLRVVNEDDKQNTFIKGKNIAFILYHPGTRITEYFNVAGELLAREDDKGHATEFGYKDGLLTNIKTPSGAQYRITRTEDKWTIKQKIDENNEIILQENIIVSGRIKQTIVDGLVVLDYEYKGNNDSRFIHIKPCDTYPFQFIAGNEGHYFKKMHLGSLVFDVKPNPKEKTTSFLPSNLVSIDIQWDEKFKVSQVKKAVNDDEEEKIPSPELTSYKFTTNGQIKSIAYPNKSDESFIYNFDPAPIRGLLTTHIRKDKSIVNKYFARNNVDRPILIAMGHKRDVDVPENITRFDHLFLSDRERLIFRRHQISPVGRLQEFDPTESKKVGQYATVAAKKAYHKNLFINDPDESGYTALTLLDVENQKKAIFAEEKELPPSVPYTLLRYQYNNRGQLQNKQSYIDILEAKSGPERYQFNLQDPNRSEEKDTWDDAGFLTQASIKQVAGQVSWPGDEFKFDEIHRVIYHKDALEQVRTFKYEMTPNVGLKVTETYFGTSPTEINKKVTQYNISGFVVSEELNANGKSLLTQYKVTPAGCIQTQISPAGIPLYATYDKFNRKQLQVTGEGSITQYENNTVNNYKRTRQYANIYNMASIRDNHIVEAIEEVVNEYASADDRETYEFYDAKGRTQFTVDGEGYLIEYIYDTKDHVMAKIAYANPISPDYLNVLKNGQRTEPNMEPFQAWQYYRDADGLLIGEKDPAGYVTEYVLDAAGRCTVKIQYAQPCTAPFNRNATLDQVKPAKTNTKDEKTYSIYNGENKCIQEVDAAGFLTCWEYYANTNTAKVTRYEKPVSAAWYLNQALITDFSQLGDSQYSIREYDVLNREIRITESTGKVTEKAYDALGFMINTKVQDKANTSLTDPDLVRGAASRYDNFGRLTHELNAYAYAEVLKIQASNQTGPEKTAAIEVIWNSQSTRHEYNPDGLRIKTTDSLGAVSYDYYDKNNRPVVTINPMGVITYQSYNTFGEVSTHRICVRPLGTADRSQLLGGILTPDVDQLLRRYFNANLDRITMNEKFDKRGLLEITKDGNQNKSRFIHDAYQNLTHEFLSVASQEPTLEIEHQYNARNQEIKTIKKADGKEITSSKAYENLYGEVTQEIDAEGNPKDYDHHPLGWLKSIKDAEQGQYSRKYNGFNQVIEENANDEITAHNYNQAARTHQIVPPIAKTSRTITNNIFGEPIKSKVDSITASEKWTHEPDGQVYKHVDELDRMTKTNHDSEGRKVGIIAPNGAETEMVLNAAGQAISITEDKGGLNQITLFVPNAFGENQAVTDPTGVATENKFDGNGNLQESKRDPGTGVTNLNITTTYGYNAQNQLITTQCNQSGLVDTINQSQQIDGFNRATGNTLDPLVLNIINAKKLNKNGLTVATIDPRSIPENPIISYHFYDKVNRDRFQVNAEGYVTEKTYDKNGRITCLRTYGNPINPALINEQTSQAELLEELSKVEKIQSDSERYYFYDENGREKYIVDILKENGNQYGIVQEYGYNDALSKENKTIHYANTIDASNIKGMKTATLAELMENNINEAQDRIHYCIYDVAGQERFIIDPKGVVTEQQFDKLGNVIAIIVYARPVVNPAIFAALTVEAAYAQCDQTDLENRVTLQFYNKRGYLMHKIDPESAIVSYQRDQKNKITQECLYIDALAQSYNQMTQSNPRRAFDQKYDEISAILDTRVPNTLKDRVTSTDYDSADRKRVVTDPKGKKDQFKYEMINNEAVITHTDRVQSVWKKKLDAIKRVTREIDPISTFTKVSTVNGKLVATESDPIALEKKNEYDKASNLKKIITASNDPESSRTFNATFNKNSQANGTLIEDVQVDDPTKPAQINQRPEKNVNVTTKKVFDAQGKVLAEQAENGSYKFYVRDSLGNLRFELEPINSPEEKIQNELYKIKKIDTNAFGETQTETLLEANLELTPDQYDKAVSKGLSLDWVSQHITLDSEKDRHQYFILDRAGNVEMITGDSIVYAYIDKDGISHTGKAAPQTKHKYNSFKEVIETNRLQAILNMQEIWAKTTKWRDNRGQVIAECSPVKAVKTQTYNSFGEEELSREYAQYLGASTTIDSQVPLTDLQHFLDVIESPQDRIVERKYDIRGDLETETRKNIPVYRLVSSGTADLVKLELDEKTTPRSLSRSFDYNDNRMQISITLEDGRSKLETKYNSKSQKIAEIGVERASNELKDAKLVPTRIRTRTHFGLNTHNQPVQQTRFKNGNPKDEKDPLIPSPEFDQTTLTLRDAQRGMPIAKQDPEGNIKYATYTANKKEARSYMQHTNWETKDDVVVPMLPTIDEERTRYDDLDRSVHTDILRNNVVIPEASRGYRFNNFDEAIAEDLGLNQWEVIRRFDQAGHPWYSNENAGVNTLTLNDLLKKETVSVKSAKTNLRGVTYDNLEALLEAANPVQELEFTGTQRDAAGRMCAKISPAVKKLPDLQAIPLQISVKKDSNQNTKLSWPVEHVANAVPGNILLIAAGTTSPAYSRDIHTETIAGQSRHVVDVTANPVPTDLYDYQIKYYLRKADGTADLSNGPIYISYGRLQINNGPSDDSQNVIVEVQSNAVQLLGNIADLTRVVLKPAMGEPINITLDPQNPSQIDLSQQPSGHYTLTPYRGDVALQESLPFTVFTSDSKDESQAPFSREMLCSAEVKTNGTNNQLILNVPSFLQNNPVMLKIKYNDLDTPLDLVIQPDEKGAYTFTSTVEITKINTLSLSVQLNAQEIIPIYVNEAPPPAVTTTPDAAAHSTLGDSFELSDFTPEDDFHSVEANIDTSIPFQPHNILYITPITGLLTQLETLDFTDVSLDYLARPAQIPVTGKTPKGIVIDVTQLPAGNYPFVNPKDRSTPAIFTVTQGGTVYSGNTQSIVTAPTPVKRQFILDPWSNTLKQIDTLGNETDTEYNDQNKPIQKQAPLVPAMLSNGSVQNIRPTDITLYNNLGYKIDQIDANARHHTFDVNEAGQTLTETLGDDVTKPRQNAAWDALNQEVAYADARNKIWQNQHNRNNRVTKQISPSGKTNEYDYDESNELNREINGAQEAVHYNRDPRGNISTRIEANLDPTNIKYGHQNNITELENKDGRLTWTANTFGIASGHTDLGGAVYTYGYDFKNQKKSSTSTGGQHGLQKSLVRETRLIEVEVKDQNGNQVKTKAWVDTFRVQDENKPNQNQEMKYEAGRLISTKDKTISKITIPQYDTENRVVGRTITDLQDHVLRTQVSQLNSNGIEVKAFDTNVTMTSTPDPVGNIRKTQTILNDPYNEVNLTETRENQFDGANRLTHSHSSSQDDFTISYSGGLRDITSQTNDVRRQHYYNDDSQLTDVRCPDEQVVVHYPDGRIEFEDRHLAHYEPDDAGRLKRSIDAESMTEHLLKYAPKTSFVEQDVVKSINASDLRILSQTDYNKAPGSSYTSNGIPSNQKSTYKRGDSDVTDNLNSLFALFDSKQEAEISGTRTVDGDSTDATPAISLYDANGNQLAIIGADNQEGQNDSYVNQITILDNLPTGEMIASITIPNRADYSVNAKESIAFYTVNSQPLMRYWFEMKGVEKLVNLKTEKLQHYGTTEKGGQAFTMRANNTFVRDNSRFNKSANSIHNTEAQKLLSHNLKPALPVTVNKVSFPPPMPNSYVAVAGDTWESIATRLGAGGLGSFIEVANPGKTLQPGMRVTVPAIVPVRAGANDHQTYSDFKAQMVSVLSPHMNMPEPDDDDFLGTMIRALAATVAIMAVPASAGFVTSALIAGLTDAAIQGVAVATGLQKKFSINDVIESSLTAGFGPPGVSGARSAGGAAEATATTASTSAAQLSTSIGNIGAAQLGRAAEISISSQLTELAIGSRDNFDVKQVIAAVATEFVNNQAEVKFSQFDKTLRVNKIVENGIKTINGTAVNSVLYNQNPNLELLAAQMLGSQVGEMAGEKLVAMADSFRHGSAATSTSAPTTQAKTLRESAQSHDRGYQPNARERQLLDEAQRAADMSLEVKGMDFDNPYTQAQAKSFLGSKAVQQSSQTDAAGTRLARYNQQTQATSAYEKWKNVIVNSMERHQIRNEGTYTGYTGKYISNTANYTHEERALFSEGIEKNVGDRIAAEEVYWLAGDGLFNIAGKGLASAVGRSGFFAQQSMQGEVALLEFGSSGSVIDQMRYIRASGDPRLSTQITTVEKLLENKSLPGQLGVTLDQRAVNFNDLWKLSTLHEGIEFAVTKEVIGGRNAFRLYSGGINKVRIPKFDGTRILAHSHPAGEIQKLPSFQDINALNKLWEDQLATNPLARRIPSRIVWGDSVENITIFHPTLENVYINDLKEFQLKKLGF